MKATASTAVSDALSDITRRERRTLLGVSTLCVAVVHANLVPTKISALGIDIEKIDQGSLLAILALVVGYYIAAFMIYAISDFIVWRLNYNEVAWGDNNKKRANTIGFNLGGDGPDEDDGEMYLSKSEHREIYGRYRELTKEKRQAIAVAPYVSIARALFDFALPLFVAVYAIYVLIGFR